MLAVYFNSYLSSLFRHHSLIGGLADVCAVSRTVHGVNYARAKPFQLNWAGCAILVAGASLI